MGREQIEDTKYWYEEQEPQESIIDFFIYSSEDADEYEGIVRTYTEYDAESGHDYYSDNYEVIECSETLSDKELIDLVRKVI